MKTGWSGIDNRRRESISDLLAYEGHRPAIHCRRSGDLTRCDPILISMLETKFLTEIF